ncbi:MAG: vitamin K epoxide reductase family protein [Gemmatimonadaceae bacterium]|nr:vitamin K epoxide reductase family protein [Gemmatimonadaceae bacterium]
MSSSVPSAPRDGILGLSYRQIMAVMALANAFVATYLHLWKLGKAGALACGGTGGCAAVQFSSWSWFLGVDVALIGAIGYTLIVIVALVGATGDRADRRGPALALAALIYPAILFTLRLKYAEFFILKTFCPWCAISAVSITILGVLAALELRRTRLLARG